MKGLPCMLAVDLQMRISWNSLDVGRVIVVLVEVDVMAMISVGFRVHVLPAVVPVS
jgi:thioredoxin-like negative regulator of GroEL